MPMSIFKLIKIVEGARATLMRTKRVALSLVLVFLVPAPALFAQCAPPVMCPRQEVLEFLHWDFSGVLLRQSTQDQAFNRRTASRFFLSYDDAFPKEMVITVISKTEYSVDDHSIEGKRAEIWFGFWPFGNIDGALRWHPSDPHIMKYAEMFHLTLSDKRWETAADRKTTTYSLDPQQWLITDEPPPLYLSVEAAIRYITGRREQTTDLTLQRNADATLAVLEKLKP
jgi:hypothetical protein